MFQKVMMFFILILYSLTYRRSLIKLVLKFYMKKRALAVE